MYESDVYKSVPALKVLKYPAQLYSFLICFISKINQSLGMKQVFKHQDMQIFGLKLNKCA